jgi:hypothetical protein
MRPCAPAALLTRMGTLVRHVLVGRHAGLGTVKVAPAPATGKGSMPA